MSLALFLSYFSFFYSIFPLIFFFASFFFQFELVAVEIEYSNFIFQLYIFILMYTISINTCLLFIIIIYIYFFIFTSDGAVWWERKKSLIEWPSTACLWIFPLGRLPLLDRLAETEHWTSQHNQWWVERNGFPSAKLVHQITLFLICGMRYCIHRISLSLVLWRWTY